MDTLARIAGDAEITCVTSDSRQCKPGCCFVAVAGSKVDGHDFIDRAISSGASAVISQKSVDLPENFPHAIVSDTQRTLGLCAQKLAGSPANKMTCVGITGTNGKSTVAHLVHSIFKLAKLKSGMIGTITYETASRSIPATMTTPPAEHLAQMMKEMVDAGVTHLVMEVSSHALDQKRTAGIDFEVAAFTNLSGDHLDYHKTMDDYLAAKATLFTNLSADSWAVLNCDDKASAKISETVIAKICNYGLTPLADLRARIERIDANGSVFDIIYRGESAEVHTPLIGRHNVYNCLAACGICLSLGMDLYDIAKYLGRISNVPGRLQRVESNADLNVFVDYAHTDDALANVLGAMRPIAKGRVIVVFGCGGDRDKTKRPRMAKIAHDLADYSIVTSDNPRTENPDEIIKDIIAGFEGDTGKCLIEVDRRKAIARAIEMATPEDVVLIAGKGHEDYQLINGIKNHFDDVEVASEFIRKREASS